ncbi:hypothetical protein [Actinacidiphila reveromycinica]|nr:hypothetical protein [Streptomyces sp. SN-593]
MLPTRAEEDEATGPAAQTALDPLDSPDLPDLLDAAAEADSSVPLPYGG